MFYDTADINFIDCNAYEISAILSSHLRPDFLHQSLSPHFGSSTHRSSPPITVHECIDHSLIRKL